MFGLEAVAMENLIAKYKARFRPDAKNGGFLFACDDYTEVFCSVRQYETYVSEFEAFIGETERFMRRWLLAVFFLTLIVYGLFAYFYGIKTIDADQRVWEIGTGIIIVLPLFFRLRQGWKLYQKPVYELSSHGMAIKEKQPFSVRFKKRIKGMSYLMLLLIAAFALVGLLTSFGLLIEVDFDTTPAKYVYGGMLLIALLLLRQKRRIEQNEKEIFKE